MPQSVNIILESTLLGFSSQLTRNWFAIKVILQCAASSKDSVAKAIGVLANVN